MDRNLRFYFTLKSPSCIVKLVRIIKKLLKIAAALVVLAIIGIAAILGLLRLEHSFAVVLPEPTARLP